MDELRPHLHDLLEPFLVDELNLTYTNHINFYAYWSCDPIEWICDVYEDRVNVRRGGCFMAADPEFMGKLRNAVRYTINTL